MDRLYRRLVADNERLTPADAGIIEIQAQAILLAKWAFAELEKSGADGQPHNLLERDTTHGDGTEMRRHPLWIAWRTAAEQYRSAAQQTGGTPMSRSRMPDVADEQMSLAEVLYGDVVP